MFTKDIVDIMLDVDEAVKMQFSNSNKFTPAWTDYADSKNDWLLGAGQGLKVVYARFQDEAGNVSPPVSDSIIFDNVPPKGNIMIDQGMSLTNSADGSVKIQINYKDNDVAEMQVSTENNLPFRKMGKNH